MANEARKGPSGSEKRQRGTLRAFRCTPAERAQLDVAADQAGMTVSAFMRHQCLGTPIPRGMHRPSVDRTALAQVLAQFGKHSGSLGKIGSNINQIAYALHTAGQPTGNLEQVLSEVKEEIAALRAMRATLLTALGYSAS